MPSRFVGGPTTLLESALLWETVPYRRHPHCEQIPSYRGFLPTFWPRKNHFAILLTDKRRFNIRTQPSDSVVEGQR